MSHTINGWQCAPRTDVILSSGANHNVESNEHLVLYPPGPGCTVTGFIPPMPPMANMAWVMTVSNGGADDIVLTNDGSGSDAGQRTLMPPGFTQYTLGFGQTVTLACVFNEAEPEFTGWFPLVPGVMT